MPGQEVHMGIGIWNRGNVLVGLYGMWDLGHSREKDGDYTVPDKNTHVDLGFAVSNDGIFFREPVPDFKVIARGKTGTWDDMALLQAHAFVNEEDRTMIWYSHWDTGDKLKTMEIGLATLRRDGFGYLSNMYKEETAHFVTTSFESATGDELILNIDDVTADAPLTVELLDEFDQPVLGFSGPDAAKISVGKTRYKVLWPKSSSQALPVGRKLAVKVTFPVKSAGKLYALYIAQRKTRL